MVSCREPARGEGVHERKGRAQFQARPRAIDDVPSPSAHSLGDRNTGANRGVLRGLHAVTVAARAVKIHPADDVAVAVQALVAGERLVVEGERVVLAEDVPAGHKVAVHPLARGQTVIKYGFPIGAATAPIACGAWVHSHNLKTCLEGVLEYPYEPISPQRSPSPEGRGGQGVRPTFMGYPRPNGRVGTRNEVWILNTVGCVNHAAERIAREGAARFQGRIDGVYSFSHPYGCGQLGDDLRNTQRTLSACSAIPTRAACWSSASAARTTRWTRSSSSRAASTATASGFSIRRTSPTRWT